MWSGESRHEINITNVCTGGALLRFYLRLIPIPSNVFGKVFWRHTHPPPRGLHPTPAPHPPLAQQSAHCLLVGNEWRSCMHMDSTASFHLRSITLMLPLARVENNEPTLKVYFQAGNLFNYWFSAWDKVSLVLRNRAQKNHCRSTVQLYLTLKSIYLYFVCRNVDLNIVLTELKTLIWQRCQIRVRKVNPGAICL